MTEKIERMREKARAAIQNRIANGLPAYRNPIERSNADPKSLRKAIDAMCYDCQGKDADPNCKKKNYKLSDKRLSTLEG